MSKISDFFMDWVENVATEHELALSSDEQIRRCNEFFYGRTDSDMATAATQWVQDRWEPTFQLFIPLPDGTYRQSVYTGKEPPLSEIKSAEVIIKDGTVIKNRRDPAAA